MKHEPRPTIHMEKSLLTAGWIHKMGGMESQDLQSRASSVSQVVGVSYMPPRLVGSVAVLGEGSEKGQGPLLAFLSGKKLSPSSCPDAGPFSSFP